MVSGVCSEHASPMLRYLLNGPAHLVKNVACALRSPCHTIYVGRYFVDLAATLDLQMPPGVFVGFDGQSDREALTLLNSRLAENLGDRVLEFNSSPTTYHICCYLMKALQIHAGSSCWFRLYRFPMLF